MLVLLVPLTLPHSLGHSLGLVHLGLLLLDPLTHRRMGIFPIGQLFHHRRPIGDRGFRFPGRGTGVIYDLHGLKHSLRK